jgi:hypothetical protein
MRPKLLSLLAGALLFACSDSFEELNTNPNLPTEVNPRFLLTETLRGSINNYLGHNYRFANEIVQYSARNISGEVQRFEWEPGMRNPFWNGVYAQTANLQDIKEQARQLNHPNYEAVALILEAWMMSTLTDTFGDVPFSEAGKGLAGTSQPVYDEQEAIYSNLLAQLQQANSLITPTAYPIAGDILFGNDLTRWKKFANSLRLRLLLRASGKSSISAGSQMQEIVSNPVQYPIFTGNTDHAVLSYLATQPNVFPPSTDRQSSFDLYKASEFLVNTLQTLNDPRLRVFAQPTPRSAAAGNPVYVGLPSGLSEAAASQFNGGDAFQSVIGARFYSANQSGTFLMTYSELQFILAEAALKGLISGDGQASYERGIKASFAYWGVAMPKGYPQQESVIYNAGLERIILQKYLHNYFNGSETWFDLRRTGFPALPPGPAAANNGQVPLRMYYPVIEQSLNETNYRQAVSRMGGDTPNSRMWLLR